MSYPYTPATAKGTCVTDEERKEREREQSRLRQRKWRAANPERALEKSRRSDAKRKGTRKQRCDPTVRANTRAKAVEWYQQYKMDKGCVDCGYRAHPAALVFDHRTGVKVKEVSRLGTLPSIKAEVAKCEVRCANCHAIRHYLERTNRPEEERAA
jgi:hypothetical protein